MFREIDHISGHHVRHVAVRSEVSGFHLGHGALDYVCFLQRKERNKVVHQTLVDQTCVKEAPCGTGNGKGLSTFIDFKEKLSRSGITILVIEHRQRECLFQVFERDPFSTFSRLTEF